MRGRRPVITGVGIICSAGSGLAAVWDAIGHGRAGLRPLTVFASPRYGAHMVGQVESLPGGPPALNRASRSDKLAWIAARQAMRQAGFEETFIPPNPDRFSVLVGATVGGMDLTERFIEQFKLKLRPAYSMLRFHECGGIADRLAARLGARGPTLTLSTACSAGALAIATAASLIASEEADIALAGGCDALCRLTLNGFGSLLLLDPEGCRPFDARRAGISLGEGAAFLVLEAPDAARRRGARVLARLEGYGASCDAWHATAPQPEGRGAAAAMRGALEDAGLSSADVDLICAHGTGTPDNDIMEARAFRILFGDKVPPFSSHKGCVGHTLAASGALNAVMGIQALQTQTLPPSPRFESVDPSVGLEPIRAPASAKVRHVLSNAFGFGGNNVAIVLALPEPGAAVAAPSARPPPAWSRQSRPSRQYPVLGVGCGAASGQTLEEVDLMLRRGGPSPAERKLPDHLGGGLIRVLACPEPTPTPGEQLPVNRRLSRLQRTLLASARRSLAGLPTGIPGDRCCVALGTALGCLNETAAFVENMIEREERVPRPAHFTNSVHNALASQLAIQLGFTGLNATLTQRETSFEAALWQAQRELESGRADRALACAADELNPYVLAAGERWGWWSSGNSSPATGDVLARTPGEGAAVFTLGRPSDQEPALAWVNNVRLGRLALDRRSRPDSGSEARWIANCLEEEGRPLSSEDLVLVNLPPWAGSEAFNARLGDSLLGHAAGVYQQVCGCFGSTSAFGLLVALGVVRGVLDPRLLSSDPATGNSPGPCRRVILFTWSPAGTKGMLCVTA